MVIMGLSVIWAHDFGILNSAFTEIFICKPPRAISSSAGAKMAPGITSPTFAVPLGSQERKGTTAIRVLREPKGPRDLSALRGHRVRPGRKARVRRQGGGARLVL